MNRLIDTLRGEHANHETLLRVLERQLDAEDGPDFDIVEAIVEYFLTYPVVRHHPLENLIFDRLRMRDPSAIAKIGDLEHEHADEQAWMRAFAGALTSAKGSGVVRRDVFTETAAAFIQLQRAHIAKEEDWFFPAALAALTERDWRDIKRQAPGDETGDPFFGGDVVGRLALLRRQILRWEEEDRGHVTLQ